MAVVLMETSGNVNPDCGGKGLNVNPDCGGKGLNVNSDCGRKDLYVNPDCGGKGLNVNPDCGRKGLNFKCESGLREKGFKYESGLREHTISHLEPASLLLCLKGDKPVACDGLLFTNMKEKNTNNLPSQQKKKQK